MLFLEEVKPWILSGRGLFWFQRNTALGRLLFHNTYSIMALPKEDCKDKNMDLISNLIYL